MIVHPLVMEQVARRLFELDAPFAAGDFDVCSARTRRRYEEMAAELFGITLDEYYDELTRIEGRG